MSILNNAIDDFANPVSQDLAGTDMSFTDADTLVDKSGQRFRIRGYDAPEVEKITAAGGYKIGEAGGRAATSTMRDLANQHGFNIIKQTGETDQFGRPVIELLNNKGESFTNKVLSSGMLDPSKYSTAEDKFAAKLAQANRDKELLAGNYEADAWDSAAVALEQAAIDEGFSDQAFRKTAFDEQELAMANRMGYGNYYNQTNVAARDYGRDLDNMANSPFAESLDIGLNNLNSMFHGAAEMAGAGTGIESLEEWGAQGVAASAEWQNRAAKTIANIDDVDGVWGKKGFVNYIGNMAIQSAPIMGVTMLSALVTAPIGGVGAFAAGAVAPSMLYAGQTYNDMDEGHKDVGIAIASGIAQGTLDRLGLAGLAPSKLAGGSTKEVIAALTAKGMTKKEAEQALVTASRREIAEFSGEAQRFAKDQLKARTVAKQALKRFGFGAATESATEVAQEAIGYTASKAPNNFETWDANEFNTILKNAAVAGGVLGGGFTTAGSLYDTGAWADLAYNISPDSGRSRSWAGNMAKNDIARNGKAYNIQEENDALDSVPTSDFDEDINQLSSEHHKYKAQRTVTQLGSDLLGAIPGLWRGLTRQAFDRDLQERSRTARIMGESFGSNLQRSTSGASYENRKHHLVTVLKNSVPNVAGMLNRFGMKETRNNRKKLSEDYYETYRQMAEKAEAEGRQIDVDRDAIGTPMADRIADLKNMMTDLKKMGDAMHGMQQKHNKDLGYINDYLSKYKSFNKAEIERNRNAFEQALIDEYEMQPNQAASLTDKILNTPGVNDIEAAMDGGPWSLTSQAKFVPGSHKARDLGLSEKASFAPFMENDIFTNMENAAKSAARFTALAEYIGTDNKKINQRLGQIYRELLESGMPPSEARARVAKLAADMKDYLDAESGNYKRLKNKTLDTVHKNVLFVTTITSLPLALISNLVEFAMISRALTKDQIFGKDGSIQSAAKEFVGAFTKLPTGEYSSYGRQEAQRLGLFDWEIGAAHTTGVTETGHGRQRILDHFFRMNLVKGWTDFARASRAAIAGDYILDKIQVLAGARGTQLNNEQALAEEGLRNLGGDPDFMVAYMTGANRDGSPFDYSEANLQKMDDYMRDMPFNFINEAVALPQSANRPKIFQDPRFALFTQFQGFISTFTANHIPKMWGEYVARGNPAMKYNMFAVMATMIALGFASQALKDWLKYGQLSSPHLDQGEHVRRAIGASGLLGTGERVIDFVFPIYQERYSNPVTWAFGTVTGESAALSKTIRAGELAVGTTFGDKPASDILKISPFTQVLNNKLSGINWGFGGN